MTAPRTIRLAPQDNVVVAVDQVPQGANIAGVTALVRVPRGHKLAIKPIA
jgi:altronate hydrolase